MADDLFPVRAAVSERIRWMKVWSVGWLVLSYLGMIQPASADESAAIVKADPPRIAMCLPLGIPIGVATKVVVRGWNLQDVSAVRSSLPSCSVKVVGAGKANVPNGHDVKRIGDSQIELVIDIATGTDPGDLEVTCLAPTAESSSHKLSIDDAHVLATEQEPNDGFRSAQSITIPQTIDGQIHVAKNVDVYAFVVTDPQTVVIEVNAARLGSALDSLLTIFDANGQIVSTNDDQHGGKDASVEIELAAGRYFISLQDAHDQGGPAHPYRLMVSGKLTPQ